MILDNCMAGFYTCGPGTMQCYDWKERCNGYLKCSNNADEEDCGRHISIEPRREKTGLQGFLPGLTQTVMCSYRRRLEA